MRLTSALHTGVVWSVDGRARTHPLPLTSLPHNFSRRRTGSVGAASHLHAGTCPRATKTLRNTQSSALPLPAPSSSFRHPHPHEKRKEKSTKIHASFSCLVCSSHQSPTVYHDMTCRSLESHSLLVCTCVSICKIFMWFFNYHFFVG